MKRTIAKNLTLIVMMLPVISFAGTYSGGDGNEASPYQIGKPGDWQELTITSADWDKHFIMTADVNLAGITITPVGTDWDSVFNGVFDGNGYILRNAVINEPNINYIGIFGYVDYGGQILNLGVEDVNIRGDYYVGGLVGYNDEGSITSCYSTGSVSGDCDVGGLVGCNYYGSVISCYSTGDVTGTSWIGGLAGSKYSGAITSCYSTGAVRGNEYTGGLVGWNYFGSITSCFWDIQTSGLTDGVNPDPNGVTGLDTTAMMTQSTFTSPPWDFSDTDGDAADWMMLRGGEDYPRLAWQAIFPGDIAGLYGVDMADMAEVVDNWLKEGCPANCEQADIDSSGYVDFEDFAILAENWLEGI